MWIGVGTVERFIISVTFNNLYLDLQQKNGQ